LKINDPAAVARQYSSETKLEARRSLYDLAEGPDPRELTFEAVGEVAEEHMQELPGLAGNAAWERVFTRENGSEIMSRHFASVERRDANGWVTIEDDAFVRAFVDSLDAEEPVELPPYELPLRSRRATSVFVATR
jgi:hypothetical protein